MSVTRGVPWSLPPRLPACGAQALDVAQQGDAYAVSGPDGVLRSPGGHELVSSSLRFLDALVRDAMTLPPDADLSFHALFCLQLDADSEAPAIFADWAHGALEKDPLLLSRHPALADKAVIEGEMAVLPTEGELPDLALHTGGVVMAVRLAMSSFLERFSSGETELFNDFELYRRTALDMLRGDPAPHRAAVRLLTELHGSGPVMAHMAASGAFTPSEYANAVVCLTWRTRREADWNAFYRRLRDDAARAAEFVQLSPDGQAAPSRVRTLIAQGEGYGVEFKSTLRLNLVTGKNDPRVSHASLKTVAAYLNSAGGSLLVGVRDDGGIEGIETDEFENPDRFALHFWQLAEKALGKAATPFVSLAFEELEGRTVCLVAVRASPRPVFLREDNAEESLYIRVGPSSRKLGVREALEYVRQQFGG